MNISYPDFRDYRDHSLAGLAAAVGVPMVSWMGEGIAYLAPVSIGIPIQMPAASLNGEILGFAAAVVSVALLASYLPARGASKIDPIVALR